MTTRFLNLFAILLVVASVALLAMKNLSPNRARPLLNVSYDPTCELYQEINAKFLAKHEQEPDGWTEISQSHGGSTHQAASVAEGNTEADVVTLALPSDIDRLASSGLIARDWKERLPNESTPYFSTIVFVVRKGNPKRLLDWPDLIRPGVSVVTPDPRTSGNGKLTVLSAFGSVLYRGGGQEEATAFVTELFHHVPVRCEGARDASRTFADVGVGDVLLAWENEAIHQVGGSKGKFQIIYPSSSIKAEPSVAWVDANVTKHHSEAQAREYLSFLFTDEMQELFVKFGFRSIRPDLLAKHRDQLPEFPMFPITFVAKDWPDAQDKFFGENGLFATLASTSLP